MIRYWLTLTLPIFLSSLAYGQLDNSFFRWAPHFDASDSGRLGLEVENLNYLRNVEYMTRNDEGRTLFGYQVAPQLHYQISKFASVRAGLFVSKDFGNDQYSLIAPLFGLTVKKGASTIHFGNLDGAMHHGLIEPLFDPERIIYKRLENGFQYLLETDRLHFDLWLDWERMIYSNSPFQEEFTAGVSGILNLVDKKPFQWQLTGQTIAKHLGGEIDASDAPSTSRYNFMYGSRIGGAFAEGNPLKLKEWNAQANFCFYEDPSRLLIDTFIDGLGQYLTVALKWDHITFMANYWDSHQFQAPNGEQLFKSVSRQNPTQYTQDYRKLLMARLFYSAEVTSDLHFLLRTTFIRDISMSSTDFIAELYFRWNLFQKLNEHG